MAKSNSSVAQVVMQSAMSEMLEIDLKSGAWTQARKHSANCPGCGRFASAVIETGYDGTWSQQWIHTRCARCGDRTTSIV